MEFRKKNKSKRRLKVISNKYSGHITIDVEKINKATIKDQTERMPKINK